MFFGPDRRLGGAVDGAGGRREVGYHGAGVDDGTARDRKVLHRLLGGQQQGKQVDIKLPVIFVGKGQQPSVLTSLKLAIVAQRKIPAHRFGKFSGRNRPQQFLIVESSKAKNLFLAAARHRRPTPLDELFRPPLRVSHEFRRISFE